MPIAFQVRPSFAARGTGPPSHKAWESEQSDKLAAIEQEFRAWLERIEKAQGMFQKHVYENPEAGQSDYRQHRLHLFCLLAVGDKLFMDFSTHGAEETAEPFLHLIESKIDVLFKTLLEWHMPPDFVDQVPESFKQGMREAAEGKLMDFPGASEAGS